MEDQISEVHFIMTGGSIDSFYDRRRDTAIPNEKSVIPEFIEGLQLYVKSTFKEVCMKDSRDLNQKDLENILKAVEETPSKRVIITVGTYKLDTATKYLLDNLKRKDQIIVLTGSSTPIVGFSPSEDPFNLGYALAIVQDMPKGVYVCFNGTVFSSDDIIRIIDEGGLARLFKSNPDAPII